MKEALIILSSYIIIGIIFWISLYIYRIFQYKKKHRSYETFTEFYVREDYESDIVLSILWIIILPIGLCVTPLYGIKLLIHKIFKVN